MKITVNKLGNITYIESCCSGMAKIICEERIQCTQQEGTQKLILPLSTTTYTVIPLMVPAPSSPPAQQVEFPTMEHCFKCGKPVKITIEE